MAPTISKTQKKKLPVHFVNGFVELAVPKKKLNQRYPIILGFYRTGNKFKRNYEGGSRSNDKLCVVCVEERYMLLNMYHF